MVYQKTYLWENLHGESNFKPIQKPQSSKSSKSKKFNKELPLDSENLYLEKNIGFASQKGNFFSTKISKKMKT